MKRWLAGLAAVAMIGAACTGGDDGKKSAKPDKGPVTVVMVEYFATHEYSDKCVAQTPHAPCVKGATAIWNELHPDQKITVEPTTDDYTAQHVQYNKRFAAGDSRFTGFITDSQWTAEAASQGWIAPAKVDITPVFPSLSQAAAYKGVQYGIPPGGNGGMLFYRKDLIPTAPTTWDELVRLCPIARAHHIDCYAGQYAAYEGLTVNAVEAIYSAGGEVLNSDRNLVIDSDQAHAGLAWLVDAFKSGTIPARAIDWREADGQAAFVDGSLMMWRGWPYLYGPLVADMKTAGTPLARIGLAHLPPVTTTGSGAVFINAHGPHPDTVRDFARFLISPPGQRIKVQFAGSLSVIDMYEDPFVISHLPNPSVIHDGLVLAKPRPAFTQYTRASAVIQTEVRKAIRGQQSVDEAIRAMMAKLPPFI